MAGGAETDDLVSRTGRLLRDAAVDYIKRPLEEILNWALGRTVSYLVAAALFITAAVFLFVGGVGGLEAAGVKRWIAYLALGLVAVLAGMIVIRTSRSEK